MSTSSRFDVALRRMTSSVLSRILPDHSKRQILFASLAACRANADKTRFNKATLHKLNRLMVLSEHEDPLQLPIRLSKVIWSGEKGDIILWSMTQDTEPPEIAADKVISMIPDWLKYSNLKGMREDLIKLIAEQRQIYAAS